MATEKKENKGLDISTRSVVIAVAVILALMIITYVLTLVIPGGAFRYSEAGEIIGDSFTYIDGGIPFWKWLLSPILVLGADGSATLIAVIIFLLVIGGVFNSLGEADIMSYMLNKIVHRFFDNKYKLLTIVSVFFMAMGTLVGSFEECIPLVPIVVGVAVGLGWDPQLGLGMSLLAVSCGFATAMTNPFTVGVAQSLAGLPMFSGIWLRAVAFVIIGSALLLFLHSYARKVENKDLKLNENDFAADPKKDKALLCFGLILGAGILLVLSSTFITALQDYTMIIVALMFLIAGIVATLAAGNSASFLGKTFLKGVLTIAPSIVLILMAASIKYTMVEAKILDTILHSAVNIASGMPKFAVILFIYLITLVMNFFISSGSAKAILLIPLLVPMASLFGISSQLVILAYVFGDGFSNVFYPTNPVTLIGCSVAGINYGQWVKFSWKFQIPNLIITSLILVFGLAIGY